MTLPIEYQWLANVPGPKMLVEGLRHYGLREIVGTQHNPVILLWWKELGRPFPDDETPWCGAFVGICASRSGKELPAFPERAMSWKTFGRAVSAPMLGDVVVFKRPGGGHVGIYVGADDVAYHVLGGNQGNAVSIARLNRNRAVAFRRPIYRNQPDNVKPIVLSASGTLSANEA